MNEIRNFDPSSYRDIILSIISEEPNITSSLILYLARQQGLELSKTMLEELLCSLVELNLIEVNELELAANKYKCYKLIK